MLDCLVNKKCRSYENFLSGILKNKPDHQKIISAIHSLEIINQDDENGEQECMRSCGIKRSTHANDKVKNIIKTIKEMSAEAVEKYFLSNICWFYRWLLSEGYPYVYEDGCIEVIRKFIDDIAIPEYVSREIKWTLVFGNYATFNDKDRETVFEDIMERFAPGKGMKTFSEIIDCWLIHHVILRTEQEKKRMDLQEKNGNGMDLYMEKILMNYISLVDTFPELEGIFGIAIEKDMEIVYNGLKKQRENQINEE